MGAMLPKGSFFAVKTIALIRSFAIIYKRLARTVKGRRKKREKKGEERKTDDLHLNKKQ